MTAPSARARPWIDGSKGRIGRVYNAGRRMTQAVNLAFSRLRGRFASLCWPAYQMAPKRTLMNSPAISPAQPLTPIAEVPPVSGSEAPSGAPAEPANAPPLQPAVEPAGSTRKLRPLLALAP